MRIENLILTNALLNEKISRLNDNTTIRGKVISMFENMATIKLPDYGIIEAEIDSNISLKEGDDVKFLVKIVDEKEIQLKPLLTNTSEEEVKISKAQNPIMEIANKFNIDTKKESLYLIENMMKNNLPLSRENILEGLRTLDKFNELVNLDNNDEIRLVVNAPNIIGDAINSDNFQMEEGIKRMEIENLDIKFILVEEDIERGPKLEPSVKNQYLVLKNDQKSISVANLLENYSPRDLEGLTNNTRDLINHIKEYLGANTKEGENEFIKILTFFQKNGIKPSLNNIKNMRDLNKDPLVFFSNLKSSLKSTNPLLERLLNTKSSSKEGLEIISTKKETIQDLKKAFDQISKTIEGKDNKDIISLKNKIDFLGDLNKDINYLFFPIKKENQNDIDSLLTSFKNKKMKNRDNKEISVYIDLNTNHLGNVRIFCNLISESLNIKINVKEEDLDYFLSNRENLLDRVSSVGYSVNNLEFICEDNLSIMDSLLINPNPSYILDLRA